MLPHLQALLPNQIINYVITDPKMEVLTATGGYLKQKGFDLRVLNLVNLEQSDGYNPFRYLRDEKDALRLVNNLIQATTPKGSHESDPFWTKSETALLQAIILMLFQEAPEQEQNFSMVMRVLEYPPKGCGVTRLEPNPPLCRFPDGRVWQFQTTALEGIDGVTQILAQNVTELYEGNARLQRDNAELRRVIAKLRKMFQRLSERIREKETLELKMRIHNNIGTSLIAISEMMNGGGDGDVEHQLAVLKDAISYFSNDFPAARGTFEEARQKAAEMHVTLELDGYIPQNPDIERLIAAAARECVTNCVNHAGGNRVRVEVVERADIYRVIITNNGKIPEREITEGGGLSSLRRSVEETGGEMSVSHRPAFALILNLSRREQEL